MMKVASECGCQNLPRHGIPHSCVRRKVVSWGVALVSYDAVLAL